MRKLAAELVGTFFLVFAGTGAIVVNDVSHGTVTHVGIALTFGLVVLALIYALGDVSGAHLNPAVTLGFVVARAFPIRLAVGFALAQCGGAIAASLCLRFLFPTNETLGATLPAGDAWQSFALELLLTMFLMFVVLSVSTGAKEKGLTAGIAVGAVIALEALFAGPICGASMNPARSLGPALVSGHTEFLWVYLAAPPLGALLGFGACVCVRGPAQRRNGDSIVKRVLFVCVENSNRSQMAEALAKLHGAGLVEAFSAGSRPSGRINPKAIEAMRELAYDLSVHASKGLDEFDGQVIDVAVTMGCGDACPLVRAERREEWNIPDPRAMPPEEFRQVRDLIERKVKELLASLEELA